MSELPPGTAGRRRRRLRWVLGVGGALAVVAVVIAAVIFKPWLIWVDTDIDDTIPVAVHPASASASASGQPVVVPVVRSTGTFISHEHDTSGTVSVIEKPDGSTVVAIRDLDTTTGPDVHVWLSAGPVIAGLSGWRTAANAAHVDLGQIKGNRGNQVYAIPPGTDLARYRAVVLWCVQFSVSFGAAALA